MSTLNKLAPLSTLRAPTPAAPPLPPPPGVAAAAAAGATTGDVVDIIVVAAVAAVVVVVVVVVVGVEFIVVSPTVASTMATGTMALSVKLRQGGERTMRLWLRGSGHHAWTR